MTSVVLYVNGKRIKRVTGRHLSRRRPTVSVNLRGKLRGTVRVTLVVRSVRHGKAHKARHRRTFHTCAKKR